MSEAWAGAEAWCRLAHTHTHTPVPHPHTCTTQEGAQACCLVLCTSPAQRRCVPGTGARSWRAAPPLRACVAARARCWMRAACRWR
eukprot:1140406-Pelagomonas_calceolata.AAC.8